MAQSTFSKLRNPLLAVGLGTLGFLTLPKDYQNKVKAVATDIMSFEKEYFLAESHHGLLGAGLVLAVSYLISKIKEKKRLSHIYQGIHLHNIKCHYVGLGKNPQGEEVMYCRAMSFAKSMESIIPEIKDQNLLIKRALSANQALPIVDLTDAHGKMIFDDIIHVVAAENDIEQCKPKEFYAFILCEDPKDVVDDYNTRISICVITPETLKKFRKKSDIKKFKIENPKDTLRVMTLHNLATALDKEPPQFETLQLKKAIDDYYPINIFSLNDTTFNRANFYLPPFSLRYFLSSSL